ncbi:coniferyl aldehyde dehydrogenase [Vibrio ostreae]|uniref:Aldehyde dehydrogenase n=1 Tax=Vibrio ostreae TaxID=2841925 RepID=A0A975UC63_9VIBR|nr:coniferyl aldehyde dehydrogenase [Vibrio ostreae]QXO18952.1 coniferyl aldehyde dehydrogenase [Vibrio ostreae]
MADLLTRQRDAFLASEIPGVGQRREKLAVLRAAILAFKTELKDAINQDFGHRSRYETDIFELSVVLQSIDYLSRRLPRFMKSERRHVHWTSKSGQAYVEYQPLGVIGIIAPWNYPVLLTLIPLATALAAGNRVMVKPSELTPVTSEVLSKMLASVFSPEEVTVVQGGPEVGAEFSHLAFDHLLFTGSTQVGHHIMRAASDNLVPVTLELGGKSPVIISKGHVNQQNVDRIVFGKLANGGQTCVAPDYALIHEDDLAEFIKQYSASVARSYPDGPLSRDYTSIINERHYQRLMGLLEQARGHGATVTEVGRQPESAARRLRTIAPTIVTGVSDELDIMQQEIFGPLLPIKTYRNLDEVIQFVNARPRPLALYYFGNRDNECDTVLRRTTSGNVGINTTVLHVAQDDLPFGGVGASGMGAYHGIEGFRAMSHAKGTFVQGRYSLPAMLRAPFGKLADMTLAYMFRR